MSVNVRHTPTRNVCVRPYAVGPYVERQYVVAFVQWELLKPI